MPGLNVSDQKTGKHLGNLCKAAMGDSFAAGDLLQYLTTRAPSTLRTRDDMRLYTLSLSNVVLCRTGTTDGPGMFDFKQGTNSTNPLWGYLVDILHKATPEEKACQHPKGILLPTGDLSVPWPWAPDTLPFSLYRLGHLAIIVVPTELTTMAGRRLRTSVRDRLIEKEIMGEEAIVVIAGDCNLTCWNRQEFCLGSAIVSARLLTVLCACVGRPFERLC